MVTGRCVRSSFARRQLSGGLLLLVCAVLAPAWANPPWAAAYEQILHVPFGISAGEQLLRLDLRHWVNGGLMAVFFLGVGLDIKRELLVGELAERTKAMLPIAAAVGGMVAPAPTAGASRWPPISPSRSGRWRSWVRASRKR